MIHVLNHFNYKMMHSMITLKGSSKENMLVELCVGNYATHDGLVNGANGIFQRSIKVFNS